MITRAPSPRTRLAGAGLVLALFVACGDGASPTTPPTPAPPTPVPPTPTPATLIAEGQESLLAPPRGKATTVSWDFTTPVTGTLDVTISYLRDDSQILVWVTDRLCPYWKFERDECDYLTKSLEGPRPRTLRATDVKAGTYSLFVANDGPNDEQVGYRVMLTPSGSGTGRLVVGPPVHLPRP